MSALKDMQCVPCRGGVPPLTGAEMERLLEQVPGWQVRRVDGEERLERVFRFADFASALAFTNRVGAAAEEQDHHPAILTEWGRVTVTWWTHTIKGLHQNDFIMAARTGELA